MWRCWGASGGLARCWVFKPLSLAICVFLSQCDNTAAAGFGWTFMCEHWLHSEDVPRVHRELITTAVRLWAGINSRIHTGMNPPVRGRWCWRQSYKWYGTMNEISYFWVWRVKVNSRGKGTAGLNETSIWCNKNSTAPTPAWFICQVLKVDKIAKMSIPSLRLWQSEDRKVQNVLLYS